MELPPDDFESINHRTVVFSSCLILLDNPFPIKVCLAQTSFQKCGRGDSFLELIGINSGIPPSRKLMTLVMNNK